MPRPEVDFQEEFPNSQDPGDIVTSINRLSLYPIYRTYADTKTKSASYVMDPLLDRIIFADASGGAITITLPPAAEADYVRYTVVAIDVAGGAVSVTTGGGNINGSGTPVSLGSQFNTLTAASDGTNYFRTDL